MTIGTYLKDKLLIILMNVVGLFVLSLYLLVVGNSKTTIFLLVIVWLMVLFIILLADYWKRKQYFDKIYDVMEHLEQRYLIQEFFGTSWKLEDQLYKDIFYRSNKAAIEKINQLEETQKEYREFIEGWIHEVKLPITGMRVAYHNENPGGNRRVETYLTEIDNAVDQALFYARSDQVYKDYQVSETSLKQSIVRVVKRNKHLLIQNQMNVNITCGDEFVMTDRKWLEFILTQILINAVKYKKEGSGEILFSSKKSKDAICLVTRDTGIGIPETEIPRIFEKGFTGSNGRTREKSTGIGLYLCRKLCRKLEIAISAESVEGEYTELTLSFPKNSYLSKL